MFEASKAMKRRWREHDAGLFPWKDIFVGKMIDVGCGPDPIKFPDVTGFDMQQGDMNHLSRYFPKNAFDLLHSSQSLEHVVNPRYSLMEWIEVVKPGGHLVITVPSWELYEAMQWPSRYNPDHKSSWSLWQKGSPAPIHVLVPEFLSQIPEVEVRHLRLVDDNYNYFLAGKIDQTFKEEDGVEAFIEFVLRKS